MTRLLATLLGTLCLGGCTTAGAPADSSTSAQPASAQTVTATTSQAAQTATEKDGTAIDAAHVPTVVKVEAPGDRRICRREVRTGTHRAVRVCRTRAEIERIEQESKETFRDLHESQKQTDQASRVPRP